MDGFAQTKGLTPILLLTNKSEIAFDVLTTSEFYVAVISINQFRQAIQNQDRAAPFFFNLLNDLGGLQCDTVSQPLRIKQLVAALEVGLNDQGDWLIEILSRAGSKITIALLRAAAKALDQTATQDDILQLAKAFENDCSTLIVDVAVINRRRKTVEEFTKALDAKAWTERDWQQFFEANIWILGSSTDFLFGNLLANQPIVRPENVYGRKARIADFLMGSVGTISFTRILEIKTPQADLLEKTPRSKKDINYRSGIPLIGKEVIGGVSQTLAYCRNWNEFAKQADLNTPASTIRPQGVLVIGELRSLKDNADALETFEEFRRCQHGVTILCYDELLERAKHMVSNALPPPRGRTVQSRSDGGVV